MGYDKLAMMGGTMSRYYDWSKIRTFTISYSYFKFILQWWRLDLLSYFLMRM